MSATINSLDFKPALKVVSCTLSSALSTSRTSLLNRFTYVHSNSLSFWLIINRCFASLFYCYPPTKWHTNKLLSCSKSSMDDWANLLSHTRATSLKVIGKDMHWISSGVCCRLKVILKVLYGPKGFSNRHMTQAKASRILVVRDIPNLWCEKGISHFHHSIQVLGRFLLHRML